MHSSGIVGLVFVFVALSVAGAAVPPSRGEMRTASRWIRSRLGPGSRRFPFSFELGGRPSADILGTQDPTRQTLSLEGGRTQTTLLWKLPESGLEIRCVLVTYADFPVAEWTLWFANRGSADTPVLAQIQTLDEVFTGMRGRPVLHHNVGSPADGSDYSPLITPLEGATKRLSAAGGRPTNTDMSYFNVSWDNGGVIMAVGWPGQWAAEFAEVNHGDVHVRAGQELTHFVLHPGEEVRSPLIVLLWWEGPDWIRGQNLWRRWMMAHSMPKPGGRLPPPQLVASSSRAYEEMIGANEANQIMHLDRYEQLGIKLDYWWMDAGWYVQKQGWPQVGTWQVDPARFPRGLRPISEHAHNKGVKILVWFEPERVAPGTWLYENHPEWLLSADPARTRLLANLKAWRSDLGGPDPSVACNLSAEVITMAGIRWEPNSLSFHPGPKGEYGVVRWTAPTGGEYTFTATFRAIDQQTTTDVHVLLRGRSVFDGFIRLEGSGSEASHSQSVHLYAGDTLDFVVGWGNGSHTCDSTGLEVRISGPDEQTWSVARDFSAERNPNGPWSYGYLPAGPQPDSGAFRLFTERATGSDNGHRLLNLGNPQAWRWLVEHVDRLITENGIDLYRQDFNMDPLPYWRAADPPDRQGITEIKHVMGYLAYWDELRRRHPEMLIDSCASGGRRNDLETMRRAVPLWRSDYAFEAIGHQSMTYGISLWLPYHGTGTVACDAAPYYGGGVTPVQPYAFWSNAAPSLGLGVDVREDSIDWAALRKLIAAWREIQRCYYGDFYPLTECNRDPRTWIAWQFHVPERDEGAVQAFRRGECEMPALQIRLRGLTARARYRIRDLETGAETVRTGATLMDPGLRIDSDRRPGAVNLVYRRVP